jgi:hypothetical protein
MDRSVDQASGPVATDDSDPPEVSDPLEVSAAIPDSAANPDSESADIESELLSSTREMGISAVGIGPVEDS